MIQGRINIQPDALTLEALLSNSAEMFLAATADEAPRQFLYEAWYFGKQCTNSDLFAAEERLLRPCLRTHRRRLL